MRVLTAATWWRPGTTTAWTIFLVVLPRCAQGFGLIAAKGPSLKVDPDALAAAAAADAAAAASALGTNVAEGAAASVVRKMASPDAVALKSWTSLKGAMETIGEQVSEISLVKTDLGNLKSDLKMQERTWHQAERELKQNNEGLREKIVALESEVRAGASVKHDIAVLQHRIEEEARRRQTLQLTANHQQQQRGAERSFLQQRTQNLTTHLQELGAKAAAEVDKAQERQFTLEGDAVALRLRGAELQARLQDGQKQLAAQQQTHGVEMFDLRRQLAEMREGLVHLQSQLGSRMEAQKDLNMLEVQLQKETAELLRLQQVQNQAAAECRSNVQAREQALCVEQGKVTQRNAEVVQFCQPVRAQHAVLLQWIAECNLPPTTIITTTTTMTTTVATQPNRPEREERNKPAVLRPLKKWEPGREEIIHVDGNTALEGVMSMR